MEPQLAAMLFLFKTFWKVDYPDWLNEFISQFDHSQETEKFCRYIKEPKENPDKEVSANYLNQIKVIPGLHRKVTFAAGFLFPSLGFMRNRYKTKTQIGTMLYYPARWYETIRHLTKR